jgi:hypothetical protein
MTFAMIYLIVTWRLLNKQNWYFILRIMSKQVSVSYDMNRKVSVSA